MKIICPVCKNITTWEENPFRPFCSERCRLIDLGAWASEEYRIPGKPLEEKESSEQYEEEE
ncbi:MAG: DNA gyrase inhibitor YacG [Nitrospiraceae bacterium]|jgi:uncharacterized protein|nr:MAG: DNA gyrase inhibitor YacG [Nitrospiraceae bacterium]